MRLSAAGLPLARHCHDDVRVASMGRSGRRHGRRRRALGRRATPPRAPSTPLYLDPAADRMPGTSRRQCASTAGTARPRGMNGSVFRARRRAGPVRAMRTGFQLNCRSTCCAPRDFEAGGVAVGRRLPKRVGEFSSNFRAWISSELPFVLRRGRRRRCPTHRLSVVGASYLSDPAENASRRQAPRLTRC